MAFETAANAIVILFIPFEGVERNIGQEIGQRKLSEKIVEKLPEKLG